MKGLLPWLREAIFGPPGPPKCADSWCSSRAAPRVVCGAGCCAFHHGLHCTNYTSGVDRCEPGKDGLAQVDLSFLEK